jgi:hypothetical protein
VYSLAVIIHGNERAAQKFRGAFKDFAEATNTIILAPLFPGGIIDPHDVDNYKFIKFHDIRFDEVLLSMVEEIATKYRVSDQQIDPFVCTRTERLRALRHNYLERGIAV